MEWLAFGLFCALFSGLFGGSLFVPELLFQYDPILLLIASVANGFTAFVSIRFWIANVR